MDVKNTIDLVDHINGNTLDNRRVNLRVVDAHGNSKNQRFTNTPLSGKRGITVYSNYYLVRWWVKKTTFRKKFYFDDDQNEALNKAIAFRNEKWREMGRDWTMY
jgi:hypothetical protein